MSKSKISKLSRVKMVGVITKRLSTIGKASNAPARELLDYYPNKLAAELHPKVQHLVVKEIHEFSKDMKSFILAPDTAKGTTSLAWFSAGQYLSICVEIDGKIYKRPYSIASSPADTLDGTYMLTIKRVGGGIVSQYILDNWKVGMKVTVSAPLGEIGRAHV